MGPLVFLWSMRFEAKHNYFKMLCHSYHNFKNIWKTLAKQHQRFMYYHWKLNYKTLNDELNVSSGEIVNYFEFIKNYNINESTNIKLKTSQILITDEINHKFKY